MLRFGLLFVRTCGICGRIEHGTTQSYHMSSSFKNSLRALHVTHLAHFKVNYFGRTFRNLYKRKSYSRPLFVGTLAGTACLTLKAILKKDTVGSNDVSKLETDNEHSEGPDQLHMSTTKVKKHRETRVLLSGLVFEIGLGLTGSLFAWKLGLPVLGKGFHISPFTLLQGALASIPLLGFVYFIEQLPFQFLKETASETQRIIAEVFLYRRSSEIGLLCMCTGIAEEIAFRSFLYSWLVSIVHLSTCQGLLLSSFLFGLFHPVSPAYVYIASLAGSYFGFLYIMTGNNVFVPAVAHAVYDYVILEISRYQMLRNKSISSHKDKID
ncbi:abortive infection protein-like protein [Galdieria sulphuraria]|uniref:Abortive infection protein-like protein n=1 Tax=Galdieria sulphuraria TaxID=130081 RepID=M2Y846_GALSU|nr:abortive infection protein-like protein [Galdieria sulphuraria]EME32009.1 abortive infection protein-like protein [Galdieria sulphuraria]|eukprot:XP_005708529.1 abortive infection protein-like protein [Galdieria sulphuraria]